VPLVQRQKLQLSRFCVMAHRAELVKDETPAVEAAPDLLEDGGPARSQLHQQRKNPERHGHDQQTQQRQHEIESPLEEQPELVVRRSGKCQQRNVTKLVEKDLAVDMGKEIHYDARTHALFVAPEKNVFQIAQLLLIGGEDDFVHDLAAQYVSQLFEWVNLVRLGQLEFRRLHVLAGLDEGQQLHAILFCFFQRAAHLAGRRAGAYDQEVRNRAKLAAQVAAQGTGAQPVGAQRHQVQAGKEGDKDAADVQPQQELEGHEQQSRGCYLPD